MDYIYWSKFETSVNSQYTARKNRVAADNTLALNLGQPRNEPGGTDMLNNLSLQIIEPTRPLPDTTTRDYDLVRRAIRFLSEH